MQISHTPRGLLIHTMEALDGARQPPRWLRRTRSLGHIVHLMCLCFGLGHYLLYGILGAEIMAIVAARPVVNRRYA